MIMHKDCACLLIICPSLCVACAKLILWITLKVKCEAQGHSIEQISDHTLDKRANVLYKMNDISFSKTTRRCLRYFNYIVEPLGYYTSAWREKLSESDLWCMFLQRRFAKKAVDPEERETERVPMSQRSVFVSLVLIVGFLPGPDGNVFCWFGGKIWSVLWCGLKLIVYRCHHLLSSWCFSNTVCHSLFSRPQKETFKFSLMQN